MTVEEWLGKDNQIGIDIWNGKYRDNDTNETYDQWVQRVSGGNTEVAQAIVNKEFLFGGRILANRGLSNNGRKITYSNCYVLSLDDSIESIFDTARDLARTFSYGGGVGIDIGNLAPRGAKVNNAAKTTSGAVSFMDLYSAVTGLIGQSGRRGALMISIPVNHPDIEEFISVKEDLERVTKANISVRITDEFMECVKSNTPFKLYHKRVATGEETVKWINARELFNKLAQCNWNTGEPGILFWDRIETHNFLNTYDNFKFAGVNPCAEEPLPSGGSCLLGSLNLSAFVKKAFEQDAEFDMRRFEDVVRSSVIALNEVLDEGLPLHPLKIQQSCVNDWRQIGLGIMGLGDALIKLGITYGSPQAIDFSQRVSTALLHSSVLASSELAKQYGSFPMFDVEKTLTSSFGKNLPDYIKQSIRINGLRNSQILTIAPTGTLSTMLGISSGIEPLFAISYTRKTESLHGKDEYYKINVPIAQSYLDSKQVNSLPTFFVSASDISIQNRISMQSTWQNNIDASISSTVNLPDSTSSEDIEGLYLSAWESGLKGITVFRDNCKRSGILTKDESTEEKKEVIIPRGFIVDVPDELTYRKYKIQSGCGKLYLFVGVDETERKIYDVFTNTDGTGGCSINTQANSRLLSACVRGGIPIEYVIEQLQKAGTCPSYQYARGSGKKVSPGKSCPSAMAKILQQIIDEFKDDAKEIEEPFEDNVEEFAVEIPASECPECKNKTLYHEGGCIICKSCGYSKCS